MSETPTPPTPPTAAPAYTPPTPLPPVPPAPRPPAGQGVAHKVITGLLASIFIASLVLNIYLFLIVKAQMSSGLAEVMVEGDKVTQSDQRVAVVELKGIVNEAMADFAVDAFDALDEDPPGVVVLRVDSPGGSPTASDVIYRRIERWQEEHEDIKVIASFGSVAASGGYYVAAGCDAIIAEETCITGSIGVIAQAFTMEGSLDKLGVSPEVLVADGSPDKDVANNTFRPWNDEDRERLKMVLNMFYDQFVRRVTDGRGDRLVGDVSDICDGDIYSGTQALENGLVDAIGYPRDAYAYAREQAGLPDDAPVTRIEQPVPLLDKIMGTGASTRVAAANAAPDLSPAGIRAWLSEATTPEVLYLAPFSVR